MKNLKTILMCTFLLIVINTHAQDVKCVAKVMHNNINTTNPEIFNSMEQSVTQFINNRKWLKKKVSQNEQIKFNLVIDITKMNGVDDFAATVQIVSTRPVFGSTYETSLFSFTDEYWHFKYQQFQAMEFQENQSVNQLTSLLAFYCYMVIGTDFDSYGKKGGDEYYNKAKSLLMLNQNENGWDRNSGRGNRNKFFLVDNVLNSRFDALRNGLYKYHINGLDIMHKNPEKGRKVITKVLVSLSELGRTMPNSVLYKMFFYTKVSEIVEIYKGASTVEKNMIVPLLIKLDPSNTDRYRTVKST